MTILSQFQVAQALIQCAYDAVDHTGTLAIQRHGVVIGEIAWDQCQCGQLVISEQRRFLSRSFPVEEVDHTAECGGPWLVTQLSLSLARCVPDMDVNGQPPAVADLTTAAGQLSKDMTDTQQGVQCCLDNLYNANQVEAWELGAFEVVGPSGGCAGFSLLVYLGHTNPCGC